MKFNISGGDETLQQILQARPWASHAETLLVVASILLNLTLLFTAFSKPGLLAGHRPGPAPWSFTRGIEFMARYGFAFFGVMILMLMLNQVFGASLAKVGIGELHLTTYATALMMMIALGLTALFSRGLRRQGGASIAKYWNGPKARSPVLGIPLFVMIVVPVALATLLSQVVFRALGWSFEIQPILLELQKTDAVWFVIVLSIFAVIVAPLVEEIVFRGIFYPTLRARFGVAPAAIINALIFALMHFHSPTFFPLLVLAVLLCFAFEYTASLPVCVIAHSLFNSMSIAAIWLVRSSR